MGIEIMMLCKKTVFCQYAEKILRSYYAPEKVLVVSGDVGMKMDEKLYQYKPRYLISFLSPWIIPEALLKTAGKAAINFHPGSPRYPGSGCYNFALYEKAAQYGVICHHMKKSVDTGDIIMTSYFDISPNETIESLKLKSMNHLLYLFEKIMSQIFVNDSLPVSDEKWLRLPYTTKQFRNLCKIDPLTMSNEEISLRIRATDYCSKADVAYIEIDENRFYSKSLVENPLV